MKNANTFELPGVVTESLKGTKFRVKLDDNNLDVICTLKGRLAKNNIRIIVGDKVDVELDAADLTKGRIVWRHK